MAGSAVRDGQSGGGKCKWHRRYAHPMDASLPQAMHAWVPACSHLMHAYLHAYMHAYLYSYAYLHAYLHAHLHAHMHAHMHAYLHAHLHAHLHAYLHAYLYAYLYAYMYACMHAHLPRSCIPSLLVSVCLHTSVASPTSTTHSEIV